MYFFNTLVPEHSGWDLADDICKCSFLNRNQYVLWYKLKFIPGRPIDSMSPLIQVMAWHSVGNKPLTEPMFPIPMTQYGVTRPWWVTIGIYIKNYTGHNMHRYIQKSMCSMKFSVANNQFHSFSTADLVPPISFCTDESLHWFSSPGL